MESLFHSPTDCILIYIMLHINEYTFIKNSSSRNSSVRLTKAIAIARKKTSGFYRLYCFEPRVLRNPYCGCAARHIEDFFATTVDSKFQLTCSENDQILF